MNLKLTTHSLKPTPRDTTPIKLVVVTMDTHFASSFNRANAQLKRDFPGLTWSLHAASEYTGNEALIAKCKADIASADIVLCGMLFLEDHFLPILDDLRARRMNCDAMVCMASATEVTQLTRFGQFDMSKPASGPMALLKKLRGGGGKDKPATGGAAQMKMLRRLPQLLRFIPGTAQDVRAYFIAMQYWLGGSDDNMLNLVRHLVARGAEGNRRVLRPLAKAAPPVEYPEVGVYHPRMAGRFSEDAHALPLPTGIPVKGTVGVLLLRSYLLSGNAGHYDGVIAALLTGLIISTSRTFNGFEKLQLVVIWLLSGYCFAISVPTVSVGDASRVPPPRRKNPSPSRRRRSTESRPHATGVAPCCRWAT